MTQPVPVGLIGVGRHGSRYLHHLLTEETGGRLQAFSRRDQQEGLRLAHTHHVTFYPDWADLLRDPSIQAIIIVTPPSLHVPIAMAAMRAGKAVLIEKPMALTPHHAQQLADMAEASRVPLMTNHLLRYEPTIQRLYDLRSAFGDWQYLSLTMRLESRPESAVRKNDWLGYGVLMEIGIHLLDLARFLTQDDIVSVSTQIRQAAPGEPEDQVWGSVTTRQGLTCRLDISRVSQGRTTRAEIVGAQGQGCADWTTHQLTLTHTRSRLTTLPCRAMPTLVPMLRDFFHALQGNGRLPVTGRDGLQAIRMAHACYESARTGRTVMLSPTT